MSQKTIQPVMSSRFILILPIIMRLMSLKAYEEGLVGDAKNKLFELTDKHLEPIRDKYFKLESNPQDVIDLLDEGGKRLRLWQRTFFAMFVKVLA